MGRSWGLFLNYSKIRKKNIEFQAECCAEMRWQLPATYKFHKQKAVDIAVDLIHFKKLDS